jgi:methionine aminotransferase
MARTPAIQTKLPAVGTTIFTVMSGLAAEKGAVNLGQGFPDFDCDPKLVQRRDGRHGQGLNQYPPMTGVPVLREAIAAKIEAMYGRATTPPTKSPSPPAPRRPSSRPSWPWCARATK